MQLLPINIDFKNQISDIVIKVIDLYDKGMINKDLNIKIDNEYRKNTNIVKQILGEPQPTSNYNNNEKLEKGFYSKISPVQIKMKKQKINWIKNE